MKNHINRFIRRTYLVLLFVPYMAVVLTNIATNKLIDWANASHAWVMKKTPIERKFAK